MLHAKVLITSCLIAVEGAQIAWGNAGPRSTAVRIAGEPTGIKDVSIRHEILTIDLRPFATGDPGRVEALYKLQNDGPAQELKLLFAFGSSEQSNHQPARLRRLIQK